MSSNIILNIPHSSTLLPRCAIPHPFHEPSGLAYNVCGGRYYVINHLLEDYRKEIPYMTDWYTDKLFINGIGKPLVSPLSRLLCDMEKYKDESNEEMSVIGMGVCYTHDHNLERLVTYKLDHRKKMIEEYYDPYHRALSQYAEEALMEHKYALVLDCHSFNNTPYKCDINQAYRRPAICIGTDSLHTPQELVDILVSYFKDFGYSVEINNPFSDTMIPVGFEKNPNLLSVMIEINRSLYLDWNNGKVTKKEKEFTVLKHRIHKAEKLIATYVDSKCLKEES